jgi:hypothetical protein
MDLIVYVEQRVLLDHYCFIFVSGGAQSHEINMLVTECKERVDICV